MHQFQDTAQIHPEDGTVSITFCRLRQFCTDVGTQRWEQQLRPFLKATDEVSVQEREGRIHKTAAWPCNQTVK